MVGKKICFVSQGTFRIIVISVIAAAVFWLHLVTSNKSHCLHRASHDQPLSPLPRLSAVVLSQGDALPPAELKRERSHARTIQSSKKNISSSSRGTSLYNIVFGIASSAQLWDKRKEYTKLWWRSELRGYVWLEEPVAVAKDEPLPAIKVSEDISHFHYTNPKGHPSAIRISRIVSETFRLGLPDVHWFVMGDDDTVFSVDNLVKVLAKYDHTQMYYIGSISESHHQNVDFSYRMAYGGGGFAISYPLAKELAKMQDDCIERYPSLFGSDDRMQACVAELGISLTRESGFHQFDVYGNAFGLLTAHPTAPFLSIHHMDLLDNFVPGKGAFEGLKHLSRAMVIEPASFLQQSICHERTKGWTVVVSWGYAVQVFLGYITTRELERVETTFESWYRKRKPYEFSFNSRKHMKPPCIRPTLFFMEDIGYRDKYLMSEGEVSDELVSIYSRHRHNDDQKVDSWCRWAIAPALDITRVKVVTKPLPDDWFLHPRKQCCRVLPDLLDDHTIGVDVGPCEEGEVIA